MKRAFLLLVVIMAGYYGYEAFLIYNALSPLIVTEKGAISEVAEKITPVLLDTGDQSQALHPTKVRTADDRIYLVSNQTLYCFGKDGRYIGQITQPDELLVADYLIDTHAQQLIVFGNEDEIYYYTFNGQFKHKVRFPQEEGYCRLRSVACYNNRIWVVQDRESPEDNRLEEVLVEYDTTFIKLNTRLLAQEKSRTSIFRFCTNPQVAVAPDTGEMYVYEPTQYPEMLLADTLSIRQRRRIFSSDPIDINIYPVRIGARFFFTAYNHKDRETAKSTWCYDDQTNRCWNLKDGFTDDIYRTGQIADLYPADLTGETYWYTKSGREVANYFPEAAGKNIPVVFIVELKRAHLKKLRGKNRKNISLAKKTYAQRY